MATNYIDNVIERLFKILEGEFKNSVKIFKMDRPDINHNSICLNEMDSEVLTTWAPNIIVERFPIDIILRHKWQKDENKKEWLNLNYSKAKEIILRNRSDDTTGWYDGYIYATDPIEIELDDNEKPKFWRYNLHFQCLIAHNYKEDLDTNEYLVTEKDEYIITDKFEKIVLG